MAEVISLPREISQLEEAVIPERIIHPRKRGYRHFNLAVVHDYRLTDETGTDIQGDITAIVDYVRNAPATVFVVTDASWFLGVLDDDFKHSVPTTVVVDRKGRQKLYGWQYGLTQVDVSHDEGETSTVKISGFGIRREGLRHQPMHQCWDMTTFTPTTTTKLLGGKKITHETLLAFALDVREWAHTQDLQLRNSLSGYASQLQRDKRFYPDSRCKVPTATNERARSYLPGNLVKLYVDPNTRYAYNVTSIDQRSAHHQIVQDIPLPNANTLHARGYFHNPDNATKYWIGRSDSIYNRATRATGLLCVDLSSRPTKPGEFRLHLQDFDGTRRVYVWTNTIPFLEATGSRIEGIYAAWTATTTDTGLPAYGKWALEEIQRTSTDRKHWLKPLLHSTYGLLAANPRPITKGHRLALGGERSSIILGAREFLARKYTIDKLRTSTTNVIQRGMIEAETQMRSLQLAQTITDNGCAVTGVFADCVHVVGSPPPVDPARWKTTELTHVVYIDRVSYLSDEHDCLPGRDAFNRRVIRARVDAALRKLHASA
jgi:hypothetical protein